MDKALLKCCYGIGSKADNHYGHVLFFDYDKVTYADVLTHLTSLQQEYDMSNIYVIKSTHGFNAICLDINPISLWYSMGIAIDSPVDRKFMKYGFERGYYTLRMGKDKTLCNILESESRKYTKSYPHKAFLEYFFDIKIKQDDRFNDHDKLKLIQFPSTKDGYHFMEKELPSYSYFGVGQNDKRQI
jgi:hypothetical protein